MRFNPDDYVTVHERIEKFYAKYPQGRITTSILEHNAEMGFILMRAEVFRESDDALPAATGHAYELRSSGHVQQSSYVEVCETSACGRALALLGFEVTRGVASREEMQKAARRQPQPEKAAPPPPPSKAAPPPLSPTPTPPPKPAPASPPPAAREAAPEQQQPPQDLNAEILRVAGQLGFDAAKVRKWVNKKYEVTGGLDSLTDQDKREVLKLFRERVQEAAAKTPRR